MGGFKKKWRMGLFLEKEVFRLRERGETKAQGFFLRHNGRRR